MGRDDVPEQHVVGEAELLECALDDRRSGFRRPGAGELAFGGEWDPTDSRAAVAGGLTDQEVPGRGAVV
jgi:hypothetical protein